GEVVVDLRHLAHGRVVAEVERGLDGGRLRGFGAEREAIVGVGVRRKRGEREDRGDQGGKGAGAFHLVLSGLRRVAHATTAVCRGRIAFQDLSGVVLKSTTSGRNMGFPMAETQSAGLVDALKKLLKSRGITYRALAPRVGLSEASIKRLFAERTFTLQRLEEVCTVLEIDFFELARLARGATAIVDEMTREQEKVLAADSKLLGVFYLLFNDWQPGDIHERYALTRAEVLKLVLQLDRLGLVELMPQDKVKLRVPKTLRLLRDGPIRAAHGRSVVATFIQADFEETGGLFRFEVRELSKASVALLQKKLDRLATEFNEIAELDSYLPSDQRETIGMAVGIRPYVVSWAMGLKPRTAKD